MAATLLPRDVNGGMIQVMRPTPGEAQVVSVAVATARTSAAFSAGCRAVELRATVAMFVRFGDSTVEAAATDSYLHAGETVIYSLGGTKSIKSTHVAAIRASGDGSLYVNEMD